MTGEERATERQVHLKEVDSRWLYNNISVGILVVDTRSREAFAVNTLPHSINIAPLTRPSTLQEIEDHLLLEHKDLFTSKRRYLREVVLVGDDSPCNRAWQEHLQALLADEAAVVGVYRYAETVAAFQSRYPFCMARTGRSSQATTVVTYPHEIVDNFLFLGNMWQAESRQVLDDLGITHIVNATLDLGNVFESDGIRYHEVKLRDEATADITPFFDPTFSFIHQAFLANELNPVHPNKVFVHCTQGISRSATLVIMYLMRSRTWSLVNAYNHVRQSRPIVSPNEGFLRALLEEERRLFNTVSSLQEPELANLLQDQILARSLPIPSPPPIRTSPSAHCRGRSDRSCHLM